MNTQTDTNIQRFIEFGAILVVISMGLNILVIQTLGSFDAGAVILGLFLGFWAFVLGTAMLVFFSSWLVIRWKHATVEPMRAQPEFREPVPVRVQAVGHRRMCPMH